MMTIRKVKPEYMENYLSHSYFVHPRFDIQCLKTEPKEPELRYSLPLFFIYRLGYLPVSIQNIDNFKTFY